MSAAARRGGTSPRGLQGTLPTVVLCFSPVRGEVGAFVCIVRRFIAPHLVMFRQKDLQFNLLTLAPAPPRGKAIWMPRSISTAARMCL